LSLKIALPKGRLMAQTAAMLEAAGWGIDGYHVNARIYRLKSTRFPTLAAKIFHEKDIPVQVAVGNYDLGICGLDWIEELLAKYRSSALVKLKNLDYGQGALFTAVSASGGAADLAELVASKDGVRIASEYPNLAESLAARLRLRRFSIFPLWGAAEAYPPDSAELVVLPRRTQEELLERGLRPISRLLDFKAYLIANSDSIKTKDLAEVVASIGGSLPIVDEPLADVEDGGGTARIVPGMPAEALKLALPDGHQQRHVRSILDKAGIRIDDYPSAEGNRRPEIGLEGVAVKVIRPQDMPLQVANGNFDLAITGRDWLTEHRHQFPQSPVTQLLDLKYGWVRVVAVVSQDVEADSAEDLANLYRGKCIRVASEYVNIADHYARVNHLGDCRVIPTWGATEAFLPEDADLLIENTETGGTIARHNLKIIDKLFESTACLVANTASVADAAKNSRIKKITALLKKAVEA
jgi:ATP phosphoribosyltransferase